MIAEHRKIHVLSVPVYPIQTLNALQETIFLHLHNESTPSNNYIELAIIRSLKIVNLN